MKEQPTVSSLMTHIFMTLDSAKRDLEHAMRKMEELEQISIEALKNVQHPPKPK